MKKALHIFTSITASLLIYSTAQACGESPKSCGCGETENTSKSLYSREENTTSSYTLNNSAGVYFISPKDGDTVNTTFKVNMGVHGMKTHKAGDIIDGTGHHHLIIDGKYISENTAIPKDAKHMHFGKGQTETEITLKPGKHSLTLQFANGHHQSYGKVFSKTIQITVK